MPDWGMWDMSQLMMDLLKRCGGYKGVHYCADDYPDGMVPVENFNKHCGTKDGLNDKCRKCSSYASNLNNTTKPTHPETGEARSDWKRRIAISLGGTRGTPEWQSYLDRATEQWDIQWYTHLLNTAPGEEVIAYRKSKKSEFGQSKPMTKRTITKVEGERVPEGWVYIVRNPDVPNIVKIGKTFPDGIPDIMSSARRFGRAELVAKYEFKEAYKAEQSIHKRLERHNLRALGYKDCGKELFQCDEMVAVFAILAEGPVLDETEDAA